MSLRFRAPSAEQISSTRACKRLRVSLDSQLFGVGVQSGMVLGIVAATVRARFATNAILFARVPAAVGFLPCRRRIFTKNYIFTEMGICVLSFRGAGNRNLINAQVAWIGFAPHLPRVSQTSGVAACLR